MNNLTLLYNALGCWHSQLTGLQGRTSRFSLPAALKAAWAMVMSALLLWANPLQAHESPPGCSGSALGINLFTDARDVHIGETIPYSVTVFNGLAGSPKIACDATGIEAAVITPDGKTNFITLRRTSLVNGDADFYPNVVSYVVRAQDILPDGTVRATAFDDGAIHQNDTDSRGGGFQGLNSEVIQPNILVTAVCVGSTGENGLITINGTVRNTGNAPLNSVTVSNAVNGTTVLVLGPISLPVGGSSNFTASYAPLNPCAPSVAVVTATGMDTLTVPRTVTSSATTTCSDVLTPAIQVTKVCPPTPVRPGQQLVYSGTVTNTGDVTLTNVTVVADQPAPNTVIFTIASLAPGAGRAFTGSYLAPTNCSTTSGVLATGTSLCGVAVSSTASSTCPILTTPVIRVAALCSTNVIRPGGTVSYSGTVSNAGDITLQNVKVVSDQPAPNTTVFTVASLAPGASASFSGSYTAPVGACTVTANLVASGSDLCTAQAVNHSASAICTVTTTPKVAVTLACPATPSAAGAPIVYTGTVSNAGDVALNNVTVTDSQANPPTVFTVASLAPGASANFTASFTAPLNVCSVTSTVVAAGADACTALAVTDTKTVTCPLLTSPAITIVQNCSSVQVGPGGALTFTGTIRNTGDVTLTNVVVVNDKVGATPIFTAATLAAGASADFSGSFTVPLDTCSVSSSSTVTAASLCGVAVTKSVSTTCAVATAAQIAVTLQCATNIVNGGGTLTYSGTVRNAGNITLTNVTVVGDHPSAGTQVFSVATLAPGASANFTGSFVAPNNTCSVTTSVTASAKDVCSGSAVSNAATTTCTIATRPAIDVTLACPAASVVPGSPITYTGTVKNTGDVTLNNVSVVNAQSSPPTVFTVATLAPGVSANFTATFTTPADACSVSTTVTASGTDSCGLTAVTDSASATCPLLTTPALVVTQACPPTPASPGGVFTYTGTVRNAGNITLTNVIVWDDRNGASVVTNNGNPTTTLWFDDAVPAGATLGADHGDGWNFITANPAPVSGTNAHQSNLTGGLHQHLFYGATHTFPVGVGDVLTAYVYIDPSNLPDEVMLQWADTTWEHRAYWGANAINAGADGSVARHYMGPLPAAGQWVRLEVPASAVGLEGRTLTGMSFTLFGGRATWDAVGKVSASGTTPTPGDPVLTQVFTKATLAPGETASFTGSYPVPTNGICSITSTVTARGNDKCTGVAVADTASITCPLLTNPAIEVTQSCPTTQVVAGALLTYTGTVRNTGDIVLTNVTVFNNRSGTTPIFTVASLAPGASANFTGSYLTKLDCCEDSSTVTASGQACDGVTVTDTATKTCTVFTAPGIKITKVCEPGTLKPGDTLTYSGTVSNTGTITLVNVNIRHSYPTPTLIDGPLILAPGESASYTVSFVVPVDFCGEDTVTVLGQDLCTAATVTDRVTSTCPITTKPAIKVTKNCPTVLSPRGALFTYTGTVKNTGDVTLVNVTVVDTQPSNNTPVIGPITLAPGQSTNFSASYIAPMCCCEVVDTLTARGQDRCTGVAVTDTATAVCQLLIAPSIAVTRVCPTTTVPVGGLFTYTGTVRNSGDVVLKDVTVVGHQTGGTTQVFGPIELAPGESKSFSGSYTVTAGSNPASDTVTATGTIACRDGTVTATAGCSGLVGPLITSIKVTNGVATVTWTSTPGGLYRLLSNTNSQDTNWFVVPGDVTASGASASKTDSSSAPAAQRFYRVTQP